MTRLEGDMKSRDLDFPVTLKYRAEWGLWEATREFVQNCMDTAHTHEVKWGYTRTSKERIIIWDNGPGFGLTDLLIGESSKNGVDTIGLFGEGMKFACPVFLRFGIKVNIRTRNYEIEAVTKEVNFGGETRELFSLRIVELENLSVFIGTCFSLQGSEDQITEIHEYLDTRFLEDPFTERPLVDKPGKVFIKGVYVKNVTSYYGYNLSLRRESITDGSVDEKLMRDEVADLLPSFPALLKKLYAHVRNEFVRGRKLDILEMNGYSSQGEKWNEVAVDYWGVPHIFRISNSEYANRVEYLKKDYKGVIPLFNFESYLPSDRSILCNEGLMGLGISKVLSPREVPEDFRKRTNYVLGRLLKKFDVSREDLKVKYVRFDEPSFYGKCRENVIYLSVDMPVRRILRTLLHEFTHYHSGYPDLDSSFETELVRVTLKYCGVRG